jgi:hypothetical protein
VAGEHGNWLPHYLYANGRPLRIDAVNYPQFYYQYDWHGNATLIRSSGEGGRDWTPYEVWGMPDG